MLELGGGKLEHVLPPGEKRASCGVVDAGLGAVEALEGALLAGERADIGGVAVVEGLEEARVRELAVDGEGLAEDDGERDEGEENAAGERVLPCECEGLLGRDVQHVGVRREGLGRRVKWWAYADEARDD